MEKIYIGFSTHPGSLLSKTIQLVEGSKYSHVYIRRNSKYGEYVYQASGLQVNFMNADIFRQQAVIVEEYEFELPENKRDALLTFFIKYAGASYELKSLFKILAILAAKRIAWDLKFQGDGTKEFICSELGAFFSETILEIPIEGDLDFITPKMLNPIIKAHGKQII